QRMALDVHHQHIHAPIVVHIADRQAPPDDGMQEIRPALFARFHQLAAAYVMEKLRWLRIGRGAIYRGDIVYGVPVGDDDVRQAVVVIIEELGAEPDIVDGRLADARREADIGEHARRRFRVEAGRLVLIGSNDEGQLAILVIVGPVYAHAGVRGGVGIVGRAAGLSDVLKEAAPLVVIEVAGKLVVGDGEVYPAVAIIVGNGDAERVAVRVGQPALDGLIAKGAVAVVVVERALFGVVGGRAAGRQV